MLGAGGSFRTTKNVQRTIIEGRGVKWTNPALSVSKHHEKVLKSGAYSSEKYEIFSLSSFWLKEGELMVYGLDHFTSHPLIAIHKGGQNSYNTGYL